MAILIRKKRQKVYISSSGAVTDAEKKQADKLDTTLNESIRKLEKSWIERALLTKTGVKRDALLIWYEIGQLLNKMSERYKIEGTTDEPHYWQVIYDYVSPLVQKKPRPKRSSDWRRNHFRLCAIMADRSLIEVKQVGNWSIWRDILDNPKLLEDKRVFDWVVNTIRSKRKKARFGHKELRPFIHATRRRLTKIDTSILSNEELSSKLKEVKFGMDI